MKSSKCESKTFFQVRSPDFSINSTNRHQPMNDFGFFSLFFFSPSSCFVLESQKNMAKKTWLISLLLVQKEKI